MVCIYRSINGVLLFDKPLELSSNTALQKIRRLFQAEKAGHTGTLDPLATGLLPVCFGEATKYSNALLDADKTYRALIRLGQTTTTGDAEGEIIEERLVEASKTQVEEVLERFRGEIEQLPPMHSALKHQGKPLYEYIREGKIVERKARKVLIHELTLNTFAVNEMDITVRCSKGTYIRTLAEDIGLALGSGAHLTGLRRTSIAHFELRNAYTLQQMEAMTEKGRDACVLQLEALMPDIPVLELDSTQIKRLAQGQRLGLDTGLPNGKVRLHGPQGFVGVGVLEGRRLSPDRLLSNVAKQAAKADPKEILGLSNSLIKG